MEQNQSEMPNYSQDNGIRDLEEGQRRIRDRLNLLSQNMIEFKEDTEKEIGEIKKSIEILKRSSEKITDFMEALSEETTKFAKKEDLEILSKQAKMFQPLDLVTKKELTEILKKKHKETLKKK